MKITELLVRKPKYSTHDLSTTWRSTIAPGWLYPCYTRVMYPGDKFKMEIRMFLRSNPTLAPVMGKFTLRVATFVSAFHNYIPQMDYNYNGQQIDEIPIPCFQFDIINKATAADGTGSGQLPKYNKAFTTPGWLVNRGVHPCSLMGYLGYPRGWAPTSAAGYESDNTTAVKNTFMKNALPYLVYLDLYRNYFINPQESTFPIAIQNGPWQNKPQLTTISRVDVDKIDSVLQSVRTAVQSGVSAGLAGTPIDSILLNAQLHPFYVFNHAYTSDNTQSQMCGVSHGGLLGTTFQPDINNNWMSVLGYQNYQKAVVRVVGQNTGDSIGYFSYEQLVRGSRQYDFSVREAMTSGRWSDILYSQYGVDVKGDLHIPQLIHVQEMEVLFDDITSMTDSSTSDGSGAALGEQGGVGRAFGAARPFVINNSSRDFGYVMCVAWLTPDVSYEQRMENDTNYHMLSDFYWPVFDNYALQPRTFENLLASPGMQNGADVFDSTGLLNTYDGFSYSAPQGYQPAYAELMTDYNTVHGLFQHELDYWVIRRSYARLGSSSNYYGALATAYVNGDPSSLADYNYPFSVRTGEDNFQLQIRFDVKAVRPKSKAAIPHVL